MSAAATEGVSRADLVRLDRLASERGIELVAGAPMAPLTTLRVGGAADRMASPRDRDALLAALRLARDAQVPCLVLGNGSDLLVADAGVRGLVVRNRARAASVDGEILRAETGAPMAMLVKRCTAEGLAGMEFGISIPGTLGGAVWANAGAHGGEMCDVVVAADTWDPLADAVQALANRDCAFDYRESRFKHSGEVMLGATIRLGRDDPVAIRERVAAHQARRQATQPLADQNAGSVFRNPAGDHAGRLIDAAGLKGRRIGKAMVSPLHANFIVTDRGARAADVRSLGELVRASVADLFGVELQYEIEFAGAWGDPDPAVKARA